MFEFGDCGCGFGCVMRIGNWGRGNVVYIDYSSLSYLDVILQGFDV